MAECDQYGCYNTAKRCDDHLTCADDYCSNEATYCSTHTECNTCTEKAIYCEDHRSASCGDCGDQEVAYTYCDNCMEAHNADKYLLMNFSIDQLVEELERRGEIYSSAPKPVVEADSDGVAVDGVRFEF